MPNFAILNALVVPVAWNTGEWGENPGPNPSQLGLRRAVGQGSPESAQHRRAGFIPRGRGS